MNARPSIPNPLARSRVLLFLLLAGLAAGCGDSEATPGDVAAPSKGAPPEARLRVRVEAARMAVLAGGASVRGTVRAFHKAEVTAETGGRVVRRVVEPGVVVEEGAVLVELESSRLGLELERSEAALRKAKTVLEHARREFERGEQLAAESAISEQRRDDLRLSMQAARDEWALARVARDTAKRNLEDARIRAPFAGTVDDLAVDVGDFVTAGTPVATVVDLSRGRIFGRVTAREAARLEPGTRARVDFDEFGGRNFGATLKRVARVANANDGTYSIELWMEDPQGLLRDGLVARVELPHATQGESLLVPRQALLRRDGRPEVFVIRTELGRHVARTQVLETGRSDGEWIEVVSGLETGDRIVVDGQFALIDGARVEIDGAPQTHAGD